MGQGESKFKGTFTFAYVKREFSTTSVSSVLTTEKADFLLLNAQDYGINKRDSGYYDPSLLDDLNYIDTTYYSASKSITTTTTTTTTTADQQQQEPDNNQTQISFADVMTTSEKGFEQVYLSCRSIDRLSPNIGMLTMIRKLDLSNNQLTELPESIGYMQSLETLILSKNGLKLIPDTIGYLLNLIDLDLSSNAIQELTPCISYLKKLKNLSIACNQISYLPTTITGLVNLISLDLTRNPLRVLPAEISQLPFLRKLRLDDIPFNNDLEYSLNHNTPSLVEICARIITRKSIQISNLLPDHMISYIKSAKSCTSCHGPFYESFVLRGRLMEKTDMHIPLEYTLCSAHWSDANDRIQSMFSDQPYTASQVIHQPYRPNLPCPPKPTTERLSVLTRKRHTPVDNQLVPAVKLNETQQTKLKNLSLRIKRPW